MNDKVQDRLTMTKSDLFLHVSPETRTKYAIAVYSCWA